MVEVFFKNKTNRVLAGIIELPTTTVGSRPLVVFAHGFDSGKDSPRGVILAQSLRERGIATLLFDFTGHGDSQGSKADSTVTQQVDDLWAAIDHAQSNQRVDAGKIGVTGSSSGGLVALTEALLDKRVQSLGLRGPRTDNLTDKADQFGLPILIVQGERDPLLPQTEVFYRALTCPKKLEIVAGADHLFSQPYQLQQAVEFTSSWFEKTLAA
ncbi:MAG TPA: alpha/beta hydrolase [Actinobacteria bacterium]|nr:alpha/beta hydrolase [Actinomycetota bacterium]